MPGRVVSPTLARSAGEAQIEKQALNHNPGLLYITAADNAHIHYQSSLLPWQQVPPFLPSECRGRTERLTYRIMEMDSRFRIGIVLIICRRKEKRRENVHGEMLRPTICSTSGQAYGYCGKYSQGTTEELRFFSLLQSLCALKHSTKRVLH